MDLNAVLTCVLIMDKRHALVPESDRLSLKWTPARLQKRRRPQELLKTVLVTDKRNRVAD